MSFFAIVLVLLSAAMHASWNLIVRDQRATNMFLSLTVVLVVTMLPLALLLELVQPPVLTAVFWYMAVGGFFLATYYVGMSHSYRGGEFTVAYPLARALPVLMVACAEIVLGNAPTPLGWLGIALLVAGCVVLPLQSLRELNLARYWNRTTFTILIAAVSIAAYTVIDSAGLRQLPEGLLFAVRYAIIEAAIGGALYALFLLVVREHAPIPPTRGLSDLSGWFLPVLTMVFVFGSYSLILWAFQTDARASYVIGLRQISLVMGVVAGAYLFHERGARLRIPAAVTIAAGVFLLAVG